MDLVFCCQAVFQTANGKFYSATAPFGMSLWNRYLKIFDHVILVARVEETEITSKFEIDSNKVTIIQLPRYKGLVGTIKAFPLLRATLVPQAIPNRAYILRMPGQIGTVFADILTKKHIPFAIEVVGDPWDVLSSIGGALAPILKRIGLTSLRKSVKNASAVLYVTKNKLQNRYPTKNGIKTYAVSDVKVEKKFFAYKPKKHNNINQIINLVAVGSLEQLYKAPDIVVSAIAQLKEDGYKIFLHWLGGGRFQEQMELLTKELGVEDCVSFYGNVGRDTVESMLESSDLFIHVSRTEGLPRAIIEAMAKGLPVIGSNVGGIPELLSEDALVQPNDVKGLSTKVKEFVNNPDFYDYQSERNLKEAQKYEDSILSNIRDEFYNQVKVISTK